MNHWIIAPVVLPALLAPILAFMMRRDIVLSRVLSVAGTSMLVLIALGLTLQAATDDIQVYKLGNWSAPFGIVLVLDRLSAIMVLLTSVLALIVLFYAIGSGWDERGRHFYPLFQFQLMGLSGAFLTGDAFNLFVFFEVLLIASYGLMIHGGGAVRLRAGLQYVVMNLAGSTLFLIALGTLYAVTGTLNIADLALKAREMPLEEAALLRVAAILLMIVFAIKAALFPVQFWLPGTYSNAPAPVAALFAIMTKVGAYALIRFYSIIFAPDVAATGAMPGNWLLAAALVTLVVGSIGVLGSSRLMPLLAFSVLASMGTLMVAVAAFTPNAAMAALYYMIHSTFAAAALFLIADILVSRRGVAEDRLQSAPAVAQNGLLAGLFFAAAIGMTGMPPLSGFLGKLLVLDATRDSSAAVLIWATVLGGSMLMIVGFARAGSTLFWKPAEIAVEPAPSDLDMQFDTKIYAHQPALPVVAAASAVAAMVLLSVFAGPISAYLQATAEQLHNAAGYISAVLGAEWKG